MAVSWPVGVNTDAYSMDKEPNDNVETIRFESGKLRTYLKNSVGKKQFSFLLSFDDTTVGGEYDLFVAWWDEVLLSGSLSFYFPDLRKRDQLTEYYALGDYGSSGQNPKEVSLTVEEA